MNKCAREIQNDCRAALTTHLKLVAMNVKRITSTRDVFFSRSIHCWYGLGGDLNVTRSVVSSNENNEVQEV